MNSNVQVHQTGVGSVNSNDQVCQTGNGLMNSDVQVHQTHVGSVNSKVRDWQNDDDLENSVVSRSPERDTPVTEGLPRAPERETFGRVSGTVMWPFAVGRNPATPTPARLGRRRGLRPACDEPHCGLSDRRRGRGLRPRAAGDPRRSDDRAVYRWSDDQRQDACVELGRDDAGRERDEDDYVDLATGSVQSLATTGTFAASAVSYRFNSDNVTLPKSSGTSLLIDRARPASSKKFI